jgi:lipopolysaccharide biosynthesis protein
MPDTMPEPDVQLIAFYLPQFHPIPENDAWWGKGFTEWRNVVRARPLFAGHTQPHLPADLGFYDLRVPETRADQAALARRHGIHGFCYYYYWFSGRRLLERPLDEVHGSGEPDFPFCICWANHPWNRKWDGTPDDVLMPLDYRQGDDRRFIRDVIPLFRDPRYIRVGGRPLLVVSRPQDVPGIRATVGVWRDECVASLLPPPYLCLVQDSEGADPRDYAFDAAIEFPPHGLVLSDVTAEVAGVEPSFAGRIWDYVSGAKWAMSRPLPEYPFFRGVMTGWDNTPRLPRNGHVFVNVHPANYQRWLAAVISQARAKPLPEERVVFINAWNEWAEGAYLEPDQQFGQEFLEATRRAIDDR